MSTGKQVLKLSKETMEILKNIASINNSMKFKVGNELKTVSAAGSVVMETVIAESFPIEFSIYDLSKLLGVLNLPNMKDAELVFEDDKKMIIQSGKSKIQYFFTEQTFVVHPDKQISLPSVEVNVDMDADVLDGFARAAAALGHKIMAFKVEDNKAYLVATTPEIDVSNDYVVELGDVTDGDGIYKIKIENLKIVAGDYNIQISAKGIMKLTNKNRSLIYFIGLESV